VHHAVKTAAGEKKMKSKKLICKFVESTTATAWQMISGLARSNFRRSSCVAFPAGQFITVVKIAVNPYMWLFGDIVIAYMKFK